MLVALVVDISLVHADPGSLDSALVGMAASSRTSGRRTVPGTWRSRPRTDWLSLAASENDGVFKWIIARYLPDGRLDRRFGKNGKITTPFQALAMAILPDRRFVVAGVSGDDLIVARFRPRGAIDTSFGSDGLATIGGFDWAADLQVWPDASDRGRRLRRVQVSDGFRSGSLSTVSREVRVHNCGPGWSGDRSRQ